MSFYYSANAKPGQVEINFYSTLNPDMDYTFTVPKERILAAANVLEKAWDAWWDEDPCVPMFEALGQALTEAGIPFESRINEPEPT